MRANMYIGFWLTASRCCAAGRVSVQVRPRGSEFHPAALCSLTQARHRRDDAKRLFSSCTKQTVVMVIKSTLWSEQGNRINKTLCNLTGFGRRGDLDRSLMSNEEPPK